MIIPVGYHVLIKAEKIEDVDPMYKKIKALGIQLADHEDRRREQSGLDRGTVIAVGSSAYSEEQKEGRQPWCSVGDFIVFAKYAGKGVKDPETLEDFLLIKDDDVVAILRGTHE